MWRRCTRNVAPARRVAGHKVYPYLLTGVSVERANQVWATDICYLPMAKGFMYLVAVMDWLSRRVLSWRVSNTLDREFCVEALEEALARYGAPEIFNTDQGAQFTSEAFTDVLKAHGVAIQHGRHGTWMEQMARNLTDPVDGCLRRARSLMHDRDPLDTRGFGEILEGGGVQPIRLPPKSPNLNAYTERFVRSIK